MSSPEQIISDAERHYSAGDFRTARRLARQALAQSATDSAIHERAIVILKASAIDPMAIGVFAITALVLLFLVLRYVF